MGKWSDLTNIFQMGWNHQLDKKVKGWLGITPHAWPPQSIPPVNDPISWEKRLAGLWKYRASSPERFVTVKGATDSDHQRLLLIPSMHGIFTYINGWFLWYMSVNIRVPWMVWVTCLAGNPYILYYIINVYLPLLCSSTNLYGKKQPGNVLHPLGMRSLQRGPGSFALSDDGCWWFRDHGNQVALPPNVWIIY